MTNPIKWAIKRTKDDWNALKQETSKAKTELSEITKEEFAEMKEIHKNAPKFKDLVNDIKTEWAKQPSFKEIRHIEKEKRRKKEAERNPGMFMRVWSGTVSIIFVILAVPLTLSIVGIPLAVILVAFAVYFWRKDVIKKPEEYVPKEFNENK